MNLKIKLMFLLAVFFVGGLTIISCKKQFSTAEADSPMVMAKPSKDLTALFMSINSEVRVPKNLPLSFDYSHSTVTSMKEGAAKAIVATQVGYDPGATVNYATFAVVRDNGQLSKQYVLKITKLSESMTEVAYLNSQFEPMYAVKLDFINKKIITTDQHSLKQMTKMSVEAPPEGDCGDAVVACLGDVYTGHGWVSVWAWIQSAALPWTTAAIAAGCVAKNCF